MYWDYLVKSTGPYPYRKRSVAWDHIHNTHVVEKENLTIVEKPLSVSPLVPTIFHEPWWLNAATGNCYEQIEVSDGHHTVGRFPYIVHAKHGMKISMLPTLTHLLGPAVDEGSGNANTRFLQRYTVTRELIAKLPPVHRFRQKLHRGYPEVLSFQAEGFRTGVQFTFEIEPLPEADAWNQMRNKTRNVIRRAEEELQVFEMNDVAEFIGFYETNLAARGRKMYSPPEINAAVCTAALEKSAGKIFAAKDPKTSSLVAAIFVAFDSKTTYYLMSTRTAGSGNGAIPLLIWSAIRFSLKRNLAFDFDGVANQGAVLLYIGFGGKPKPTYIVAKDSKRIKFLNSSRGVLGLDAEENFFDYF